jgi:enterochelin esterase-like enzyme
MQRLSFSIALGLAFVTLSVRADTPPEPVAFPAGVKSLYEALSTSMRSKDMRGFMKLFHINFVYEGEDKASLDRGPWRRLWLDRFGARSFELVSYYPEQAVKDGDERIVIHVGSTVVFADADDGSRRLETVSFEDTLVREGDSWEFILRVRKRSSVGHLAPKPEIQSPRLAALAASLEVGDPSGLVTFWKHVEMNGTPLVEPDEPDSGESTEPPKRSLVTFLWRGGNGETQILVTRPNAVAGKPEPLQQLGNSDVWYLSTSLPNDARFRYQFALERTTPVAAAFDQKAKVFTVSSTSTDPLNSKAVDEMSLVELPGAPTLAALQSVDGRPEGTLERETVRSKTLKERRFVSVYRPPSYDESGAPYPAVFLLDRGTYGSRQATRILLDNLIAEKKIPAAVVFLFHSEGSRSADLDASSRFVDFLGTELLEWARKTCHISRQPADIVIGGNKLGGALAVHCASRYPAHFGNVLTETGDFSACLDPVEDGERGCAAQRFSAIPKQELRFYLAVAELENESLVNSSWHLRDVLNAKGYSAPLLRQARNHHSTTWLEALAQGLEGLLGRK